MDAKEWEAAFGGWDGFEVERIERQLEGMPPTPTMRFFLRARADQVRRCSRCGEPVRRLFCRQKDSDLNRERQVHILSDPGLDH